MKLIVVEETNDDIFRNWSSFDVQFSKWKNTFALCRLLWPLRLFPTILSSARSSHIESSWGFSRFVNLRGGKGETPLHLAARQRRQCVHILLDNEAAVCASTGGHGEEKGNNPEIIRESQRRRFANVEIVDEIIQLDKQWRQRQFELKQLPANFNDINIEVAAKLKIDVETASSMTREPEENIIAKKAAEVEAARATLYSKLEFVGNLVHGSVPVSNDKANNAVIRTWGEIRTEPNLKNHVELLELLGIANFNLGARISGEGSFIFIGDGVGLQRALILFSLQFLEKRGFTELQGISFMRKGNCAQVALLDESRSKVIGEGDDKYLISNAEQPLCAYHIDEWIHPTKLPLRHMGHTSCLSLRGRRVLSNHEFKKVEQLGITSPNGNASWDMQEEIIKNSEELYQILKLPYQVVSLVSGSLHVTATKTYDLEAWFPASNTYKKLLYCSNSTDYQSRKLDIRYGQNEACRVIKKLSSTAIY